MRNFGPVVALTGAILMTALGGCPDGGGTAGTRPGGARAGTPTPAADTQATTAPGTGSATATPAPTGTQCPAGQTCGAIDNTGGTPQPTSTPLSGFTLTNTSLIHFIQVYKRGTTTPVVKDSTNSAQVVTFAGAKACLAFDGWAQYQAATASLNWSADAGSVLTASSTGDVCIAADAIGDVSKEIAITATATGAVATSDADKANYPNSAKTFKFYVKVNALASGSLSVN
ncbi:MAG: hypothetical protein FJZ01_27120 [Candidatus Sericytochromatia bacterium]|nr:hypothetical protein [Candidatus Tanganyikabacteria bacterium]